MTSSSSASSAPPAISIAGVSKIYSRPIGGLSLRGTIARLTGRRAPAAEPFKALDNVTLDVFGGQTLGLIGANGAGKSTLLKLIGGVTGATTGTVDVRGRLAPLIEVGAGFHPDLTGRENVYLNAAMLGLRTAEINDRLEDIIHFAGLGEYIDMPIRSYSSGMVVRLGFAVAIHVTPDILLIDEVLSVGDLEFRARSYERIENERRRGTTIVLVSHSLPAITSLCDQVVWFEKGRIRQMGPATDVVNAYQDEEEARVDAWGAAESERARAAGGDFVISRVETRDASGDPCTAFTFESPLAVTLHYRAARPLPSPYFMVTIEKDGHSLFAANMLVDGRQPDVIEGEGHLTCVFDALPLLPGRYQIGVQVRSTPAHNYYEHRVLGHFTVDGKLQEYGFTGHFADTVGRHLPPVIVPYHWSDSYNPRRGSSSRSEKALGVPTS